MFQIGRRRSTGSPEWREWLVARESLLLNEGERGEERRGEVENFYKKRGDGEEIIYSEEESTAPSSLSSSTSSTSSTYSSSSCASDSESEEGFHPGRFALDEGEVRSFQLDEEDYPDSVRAGGENGEKDFEQKLEEDFPLSSSSSPPPPPPSPTPFSPPTSLRLSPLLRTRRSSLPQI